MEKICIVKRRKKNIDEMDSKISNPIHNNFHLSDTDDKAGNDIDSSVISFNLHDEHKVPGLINSSTDIKCILEGLSNNCLLKKQQNDEGEIVFNLVFKQADIIKMLKPKDVCKMLQISRNFLMKLVEANEIRGYRIGKLRRFSSKDILDFLDKNKD